VLVGDAAHVVHPLAGQGVNLGLQDAEALLDGVARARAAGRRIDDRLMLRRYERVRRSENAIAARSFDAIHRLFSSPHLLPSLVRGPALGWVDRIAPLKRMLARHAMGLARR
jgi:2-polyprenyl-6-methoxyphenol hydroxylase-like FAD-dependent oxidoreductase